MMGRMYSEPGDFVERVWREHLEPLGRRFIAAFQRSLPHLPRVELIWRVHFSIGALSHTMAAAQLLRVFSDGQCDPSDLEGTLARMIAFMAAGLAAPVPEIQHVSV